MYGLSTIIAMNNRHYEQYTETETKVSSDYATASLGVELVERADDLWQVTVKVVDPRGIDWVVRSYEATPDWSEAHRLYLDALSTYSINYNREAI